MYYVLTILLAVINAGFDYHLIKQMQYPNHTLNAICRGVVLIFFAWLVGGNILVILSQFVAFAAIFWIVFEMVLNKLRGLDLLYVGETAKTDLFIRSLYPFNPGFYLLIIKVTILILAICLIQIFGKV